MKNFTKLISSIAFIWLMLFPFSSNAMAASSDPVKMLESTTSRLLQALKQNRSSLRANPKRVRIYVDRIVLPIVDSNNMARFAMGRSGWMKASGSQRKEFIHEFISLIVGTYSSALAAYQDQTVNYFPIRGGIQNKTRVSVKSNIVQAGGRSIPINYRLVRISGRWKVYDFSVEGVSMIQSFRSQFSSYLNQKEGVANLLRVLKNHNQKLK
jgi:phospholipid transport system substrate-binding protein